MGAARQITKDAQLNNLAEFRKFIEESCAESDFDVGTKYDLVLVVDEVCTNIIIHGYEEDKSGKITIKANCHKESIKIVISDTGKAFDPRDAPEPDFDAQLQERAIGGLGVYLLKQIADSVNYKTDKNKVNHLTIIKKKPAKDKNTATPDDPVNKGV